MTTSLPQKSKVTLRELEETLTAIDTTFRAVVEGNLIHQLYDPKIVGMAYERECDLRPYPFEQTMWNRKSDNLDRCEQQVDFQIRYIHGHHLVDIPENNVCNLDNDLGKSRDNHVGQYSIIYRTNHLLPQAFVDKFQFYSGTDIAAIREERGNYHKFIFSDLKLVESPAESTLTGSTDTPPQSRRSTRGRLFSLASTDSEPTELSVVLGQWVVDSSQRRDQPLRLQRERMFSFDSNGSEVLSSGELPLNLNQ